MFSEHQRKSSLPSINHADESGLFWNILPDKILASVETSATGSKVSKERITFMSCANSTENYQLRFLVVVKAKKPWSFGSVHYQGQRRLR